MRVDRFFDKIKLKNNQKNDKTPLTYRKSCDTILNCIIIANYAKKRAVLKTYLLKICDYPTLFDRVSRE